MSSTDVDGIEEMKRRVGVELREWLQRHPEYGNISAFARRIGLPESTVGHWFRARFLPKGQGLHKILEVTNLPSLRELASSCASVAQKQEQRTQRSDAGFDGLDKAISKLSSASEQVEEAERVIRRIATSTKGRKPPISPSGQGAGSRAANIRTLLGILDHELDFFKRGSRSDRAQLRRAISGEDLGYIIALLKALYAEEDEFQNWLFFANYKLGRGEHRK